MSRRCKRRRVMAEMNVVPYIDVMLVLLVIFMVTAPMMQTGVQIDLPDANAETLETDGSLGPLMISVDKEGAITLEDGKQVFNEISESELITQMIGKLGDKNMRPVNIRADSNIAYKVIMRVMVAAQKAGAKKIGLVADIETSNTQ
ncbi:MAG TPA: protein TolR [Leucothrix sp.]|nr:protein TolR [Leucothrix sp.]